MTREEIFLIAPIDERGYIDLRQPADRQARDLDERFRMLAAECDLAILAERNREEASE